MFKNKPLLLLSIFLLIVITACNLPGGQSTDVPRPTLTSTAQTLSPESPTSDLALTITAQVLLLESPTPDLALTITAQAEKLNSTTPDLSSTSTAQALTLEAASYLTAVQETGIPEYLPTSGTTTVTVSQNTNCRRGPGTQYDVNGSLLVGQTAEVVGKNLSSNYWIIKTPGSSSGTCWLWGQYATIIGDTSSLAEITAPPTPTPTATPKLNPPAAVSNVSEQNTCTNIEQDSLQEIAGTLSWTDNSNNETGFNIYFRATGIQNSVDLLIATVGANNTSYNFNVQSLSKSPIALKVEAFNDAGKSQRKAINIAFNCP